MLPRRVPLLVGLFVVSLLAPRQLAAQSVAGALRPGTLRIDGLGKGTAPLDGPWQFHLGDDFAWALPQTHDWTGAGGWEQLAPDRPWGAQGHRSYTGFAWYRKHIGISPAPGAAPDFYLLIRHIDDVYEVYWNGQIIGHNGDMPPHPSFLYGQPAQIVNLGPARDGVLAIRVWKAPLTSFDDGLHGGLDFAPEIGSVTAVAMQKTGLDYTWLRGRQYYFGLQSLYGLMMLLSLLAWLRNPSQRVLLAMAVFTGAPIVAMILTGLRLPFSYNFALAWLQPVLSLTDIGLWFVLLYLLELDRDARVVRLTRTLAVVSFTAASLDGLLTLLDWSRPGITVPVQVADAALTVLFTTLEMFPLVLIALGLRKQLDMARWFLAAAAAASGMFSVIRIAVSQGSRYTHWTIAEKLSAPVFFINGNAFTLQVILNTVLLVAVIYAVYRYMQQTLRRQGALEQELKSARELQQVLIPESLPELPGFAVTSAYRPAQEVGGDFFQIIPLEGEFAGATLILLGDVSGKGLRAAMTVSLIVGSLHTLAKFIPRPAEILAELNQRLCGRLQGGFTTCLALRLDPDGHCAMATAGHPAPYLNQREIPLPGALPLGVVAQPTLFRARDPGARGRSLRALYRRPARSPQWQRRDLQLRPPQCALRLAAGRGRGHAKPPSSSARTTTSPSSP